MSSIGHYWHTVRYLRPVQLYGRVGFRLRRPRPNFGPFPPLRSPDGIWRQPTARPRSCFGDGVFEFLGVTRCLDQVGWDGTAVSKLWRYNLHYFDDLLASDSASRRAEQATLIKRWIYENPAGRGSGWEPYPTSLRIVNWFKWLLSSGEPGASILQSLAVQARWLMQRLEYHLLGNHLWVNGKALTFIGTYFCGPEADRWRAAGLDILRRELDEQVLSDGAHFERSPMYHALFVEDLLDLCNLAGWSGDLIPAEDRERWVQAVPRMLSWLRAVSHDDLLAHFNDVAQGIAPPPSALMAYSARLGFSAHLALPEPEAMLAGSGLVRLNAGQAVVIADAAPVGPDYMPGHAHADTLSFEFSIGGHRVFVNEGTSTYDAGAERLRQRGTGAHNTVVVDGADSSEVWASFRVARRARIVESAFAREGGGIILRAAHDGYRRLRGRVTHRRTWGLYADRLEVTDELDGRYASAEARLLLAPGWDAVLDGDVVRLRGFGACATLTVDGGAPQVEPACYHGGFSVGQPTQRIRIAFREPHLRALIVWRQSPGETAASRGIRQICENPP